jgi:hypothetical protein
MSFCVVIRTYDSSTAASCTEKCSAKKLACASERPTCEKPTVASLS